MAHVRSQIRNAVVSVLNAAGLPTTNIQEFNADVVQRKGLPAIIVAAPTDAGERLSTEIDSTFSGVQPFVLPLSIAIMTENFTTGVDAQAIADDDYCAPIQAALYGQYIADGFGALVTGIEHTGTTREIEADGDADVMTTTLNYDLLYRIRQSDPETAVE